MRSFRIVPKLQVSGFASYSERENKDDLVECKVNKETKVYAARKLLEHGPLSFSDFQEITGWEYKTCRWVLTYLVDVCGIAWRGGRMYGLVNA